MPHGLIYSLHDPITEELRYIGQTTQAPEQRLAAHLAPSSLKQHSYLYRWLGGLVKRGQKPIVKIIAFANNQFELDQLEISHIKAARENGTRLVNTTAGGGGRFGCVVSPETREKISAAQRGKPRKKHTEASRAKISAANLGSKMPAASVAKSAAARRGAKRSLDTCARISAGRKGKGKGPRSLEWRTNISKGKKGTPHLNQRKENHGRWRHDIKNEDLINKIIELGSRRAVARFYGVSPYFVSYRLNTL